MMLRNKHSLKVRELQQAEGNHRQADKEKNKRKYNHSETVEERKRSMHG